MVSGVVGDGWGMMTFNGGLWDPPARTRSWWVPGVSARGMMYTVRGSISQ